MLIGSDVFKQNKEFLKLHICCTVKAECKIVHQASVNPSIRNQRALRKECKQARYRGISFQMQANLLFLVVDKLIFGIGSNLLYLLAQVHRLINETLKVHVQDVVFAIGNYVVRQTTYVAK